MDIDDWNSLLRALNFSQNLKIPLNFTRILTALFLLPMHKNKTKT